MRLRHRGGTTTLRLDDAERAALVTVVDDLNTALDSLHAGDPVWDRLNPAAFDDEAAAEDFRALTGDDLDRARRGRLQQVRAELAAGTRDIRLDAEDVQRWLAVLNDVRLALGTRLQIGPDDPSRIDPDDPQGAARAVYYWLTALQSGLVDIAMS